MSDLAALIRERVGEPFGMYFGTVEGDFMPDGTETYSGHVVDAAGRHWGFWTGWDGEKVALADWWECAPEPSWVRSREYLAARRKAGLDS